MTDAASVSGRPTTKSPCLSRISLSVAQVPSARSRRSGRCGNGHQPLRSLVTLRRRLEPCRQTIDLRGHRTKAIEESAAQLDQEFRQSQAGCGNLPGLAQARDLAVATTQRPTASIGSDSTIPMVSQPPARYPIWMSGSLKNSTNIRDSA